jgi:hypothetical protein
MVDWCACWVRLAAPRTLALRVNGGGRPGIAASRNPLDDLPGAHAVDRLAPAVRSALTREEQRLVIVQPLLARPPQQLGGQRRVSCAQRCLTRPPVVFLRRPEAEPVPDVARTQREHVPEVRPRERQRSEQESVAFDGHGRGRPPRAHGREFNGYTRAS